MSSKPIAYYKELIELYLNAQCTPEQEKELWMYLSSSRSNKPLLEKIKHKFSLDADTPQLLDTGESRRILTEIMESIGKLRMTPKRGYVQLLKIAAVLILVAGTFFIIRNRSYNRPGAQKALAGSDVPPGGNKGFLVLSNGTRVSLEMIKVGDTIKKNGLIIAKSGNGEVRMHTAENSDTAGEQPQMNTVQTPVGGQYKVTLSDGTMVWMNAESVLKFPASFTDTERLVQAEGELYFEVTKDATRPFKVQTGQQVVEVLGTHFSIKSSTNNAIVKTALLEGRIRITGGASSPQILEPGEVSEYQAKTNELKITAYKNLEETTAWKDGYFLFDSTDFIAVQDQLQKWYNVTFVYEQVPRVQFFGKVPRNVPLSRVLRLMEMVGEVKFKIEGRKIYVITE